MQYDRLAEQQLGFLFPSSSTSVALLWYGDISVHDMLRLGMVAHIVADWSSYLLQGRMGRRFQSQLSRVALSQSIPDFRTWVQHTHKFSCYPIATVTIIYVLHGNKSLILTLILTLTLNPIYC